MHKSATKCNETVGKWCKNKHGASKIIDTLETYQGSQRAGHSPRTRIISPTLTGHHWLLEQDCELTQPMYHCVLVFSNTASYLTKPLSWRLLLFQMIWLSPKTKTQDLFWYKGFPNLLFINLWGWSHYFENYYFKNIW
jgi:hypothetical protein